MLKDTVNLLKCPDCGASDMQLAVEEESDVEIRSGTLACGKCSNEYKINKGIADLLHNPSQTVLDEIEGEQQMVADEGFPEWASDEALLQMPYYRTSKEDVYGHFHSLEVNFTEIVDRLDIQAGQKMLDVGVAQGWTSHFFAKKGIEVIATDINHNAPLGLGTAEVYLKNKVYFERVRCDMHTLPFLENTFDYIFFNNAIHHSSSLETVIKKCYNLLKPGGKLILIGEPSGGIFSISHNFGKKEREVYHINENLFPFLTYWKTIKKAGFKNTEYIFPPAIDLKLTTGKYGWPRVNKGVFRTIHYIWRINFLRPVLKPLLFWPAAVLYNFTVNCISEK